MKNINWSYRYLVTQPDLNAHGTLHGGNLMKWVDEACGMQARLLTGSICATRNISEINFISSASRGDIVQIEVSFLKKGKTSITFYAKVVNASSGEEIAEFNRVVFVGIGEDGKSKALSMGRDENDSR